MFRLKYKSKHTLLLILPTIAIILLGLNFNSPYDIVSVWIASVYAIVVNCFLKVKYKRRKNEFA
jgi:predicted membrane protein